MNGAVAERYAQALFEAATDDDSLVPVQEGLQLIKQLLAEVPDFGRFLEHPEIALEEKATLLRDVFSRRLPPLAREFVLLLVRKQRLLAWTAMLAAFEERYRRSRRLERALVRSARPLPPELLQQIDDRLEQWRGTQIDLATEIDPTLLGGVQVRIGSLLVDGSIRSRLEAIAQHLQTVPV